MEIHISVRNLVEFLLRSGDLDNRIKAAPEQAMQAGSRMHRRLQKQAGAAYTAEVALSHRHVFATPPSLSQESGMEAARESREGVRPSVACGESGSQVEEAAPRAETEPGMAGAGLLENAAVIIEGRADGIYRGRIPLGALLTSGEVEASDVPEERFVVDEIKTTYRNLRYLKRPEPVHTAQARCYAYFYAFRNRLPGMYLRMTYCNLDTEEVKYFYERVSFEELRIWFESLMAEYRKWAEFTLTWQQRRTQSIRSMSFPFPYREGQKELAEYCYRTICHGRKLFLEAPTGAGKTITTLFPAVKAIGEGKAQKIFYLTAKTIARTVANDTVRLMRSKGLLCKSVVLTARDRICVLEKADCNPGSCARARGHFDRINEALYDLLTHEDNFDRETLERYAAKYEVCPFEMGLDMSLFSDVIICDYNYVFDPHVSLRRFFGEGEAKGEYLFLIDEAHNLVDRGREMYSASLFKEEVLSLRREVKGIYPKLEKPLTQCNAAMLELRRGMEEGQECRVLEVSEIDALSASLFRLQAALDDYLEEDSRHRRRQMPEGTGTEAGTKTAAEELPGQITLEGLLTEGGQETEEGQAQQEVTVEAEGQTQPEAAGKRRRAGRGVRSLTPLERETLHTQILDFFFVLSHFLLIYEKLGERYVIYAQEEEESFYVKLFNVDPSENLRECMERGRASVLFSATLLPIQYYKQLLGGTGEDYEVYARSAFDPRRRALLVAGDVTSKYSRRGPQEYARIAEYIHQLISARHGNYMVFFPSYAFLREIAGMYEQMYAEGEPEVEIEVQRERMSEEEKEAFLSRFGEIYDDRSFCGFCVLGGIFSEGIDLKKDALIGVIVVGTGLPQICSEREILKDYFAQTGVNGYDYAYRFPGMNKVLQAAGRVIRTQEDVGVVALLDERFLQSSYRRLFPREWDNYEIISLERAARRMDAFWDEWL
ncbi:MAG: ATP-dependent DNA helicase [Eubacteriales bacterium]|nr:ATP-dependent DNA helicase [Eubacteriales bacterium]